MTDNTDKTHNHFRCMHLGPYSGDRVIIFHDLGPGVYAFHVLEMHEVTLGFIRDPSMSIFKLPDNRQCLATIYAVDASGNFCFEVKLLPRISTATATTTMNQTSSSSSSQYCYHQGCEPYQLTCPPGQVPACETREVFEGDVTLIKTVMHCITPSPSSSSSSSSASP